MNFICLVFLLITTGTWAYSRNCAKGPEYWCRDASTAKACGAVRHCEQTVWRENRNNKPSMTTKETAEMLCNVLVQASNKLLTENTVKFDSIREYLRQDCTNLPKDSNLVQNVGKSHELFDHYFHFVFIVSIGCRYLSTRYSSSHSNRHRMFAF